MYYCSILFDNFPTVYSESGIQYDRNGNIKRLVRTGYTSAGTAGEIDRMRYNSYTGNQLVAIRDSAGSNVLYSGGFEFHQVNGYKTTQYAYNSNGAMKYDSRSGGFANPPERINYNYPNNLLPNYPPWWMDRGRR